MLLSLITSHDSRETIIDDDLGEEKGPFGRKSLKYPPTLEGFTLEDW